MKAIYYLVTLFTITVSIIPTLLGMEKENKHLEPDPIPRRHSLTSTYDEFVPFASPVLGKNEYSQALPTTIPLLKQKISIALLIAARENRAQEVKIALEQGANIKIATLDTNKTSLHFAVENNNSVMVQYLVIAKANPFIQQKDGSNALSLMKKYHDPNEQNTQLDILQKITTAIVDQKLTKQYTEFVRYTLQSIDNHIHLNEYSSENAKINMHIKIIKIINYYLQRNNKEEFIPNIEQLLNIKTPPNPMELTQRDVTLVNGWTIPVTVDSTINSILELYDKNKKHPKIKLYQLFFNPETVNKKTDKEIKKIKKKYNKYLAQQKSHESLKKETSL